MTIRIEQYDPSVPLRMGLSEAAYAIELDIIEKTECPVNVARLLTARLLNKFGQHLASTVPEVPQENKGYMNGEPEDEKSLMTSGICKPSEIYADSVMKALGYFNKRIGKVIIGSVFKVIMREQNRKFYPPKTYLAFKVSHTAPPYSEGGILTYGPTQKEKQEFMDDLAKNLGFASANRMFTELNRLYSLRESKEFYVTKFRWLK